MTQPSVKAVFFDVDFTLIYPGQTFQGEGYASLCASYGIEVDPSRFSEAVVAASSVLDDEQDHIYDAEIFVGYTRRIIEHMGPSTWPGTGGLDERLDACAWRMYNEWAACQHFYLYDDVSPALSALAARGVKVGLISNSHRCLASFQQHFELHGLIAAAISSSEHGYMKPHPSIFSAALKLVGVTAGESIMVGDSVPQDIEGARHVGMRGVLVHRSSGSVTHVPADVPVIRGLLELEPLL